MAETCILATEDTNLSDMNIETQLHNTLSLSFHNWKRIKSVCNQPRQMLLTVDHVVLSELMGKQGLEYRCF